MTIMRGGSGPPCATLSKRAHFQFGDFLFVENFDGSGPLPWPWLRPFSARICGVSLLDGSLTRSRAKFCASAMTRPRGDALFSGGLIGIVETGDCECFDRFVVFLVRLVFVGFEIGRDSTFGERLCCTLQSDHFRATRRQPCVRTATSNSAAQPRRFSAASRG